MDGFRPGRSVLAAMLAGLICAPTLALAQDDDWEFNEDTSRHRTTALVQYEGGKSIFVQCDGAFLTLAISGVPATTEVSRTLLASRADGRTDTQLWTAEPGETTFRSTVNGRDARFLKGGGMFEVRSPAGSVLPIRASFDLPPGSANLDRVLRACGYPLSDERDLIPRADPAIWSDRSTRRQRRLLTFVHTLRQADASCIVRNAVLADCRATMRIGASRQDLQLMEGRRLDADRAAANEGRVIYLVASRLSAIVDDPF